MKTGKTVIPAMPVVPKGYLTKKFSAVVFFLSLVFMAISVVVLLWWRYQFGQIRFFDIDEFAHLHWTHNLVSGLRPYTDFFYFTPPFYLYTLAPLFAFAGKTINILLYGRLFSFLVFAAAIAVLFLITRRVKNVQTALLTVLIFAAIPMPSDKWIEIRPDGISTLFSLVGILFLIEALNRKKIKFYFLSGLFYSISLILLPKVAFFILTGTAAVVMISLIQHPRERIFVFPKPLAGFAIGGIIPVLVMLFLFVLYGDPGKAILLVTKVANDASRALGYKYPISPNFWFYPNDLFYGDPGWSIPWKANLAIWLLGIFWIVLQLVTFLSKEEWKDCLVQFLLSSSAYIYIIAYIEFFPLKHAQYLIPASPFIAYFLADFIQSVFSKLKWSSVRNMVILAFALGIFFTGKDMFDWKLKWNNQWSLNNYKTLYSMLSDEPVIDLTGETVFGKEAYYFCCIPYGQYAETLNFPYPNLETVIKRDKIKYVFTEGEGRVDVMPFFQQYTIRKYYTTSPDSVYPLQFLYAGTTQTLNAGEEKSFELIVSGTYKLWWNSTYVPDFVAPNLIFIDGLPASAGSVYLTAGIHHVRASQPGEVKIVIRK